MRNIKKEAERLASLSYSMEVLRDETTDGRHIFMAKCIELEGCMAQGETIGQAMENLQDAMIVYIESLLEDKLPVPYPREGSIKTVGTLDSSVGFVETYFVSPPSTFLGDLKRVAEKKNRQKLYEVAEKT